MNIPDFKINQKIEILYNKVPYKSNIEDITDDGIYIDIPYSAGENNFELVEGMNIKFLVTCEFEILKCSGVVKARKRERYLRLAYISDIDIIEKIQRRDFYRIPITMKVYYFILDDDTEYNKITDVPAECYDKLASTLSMDLSGGGVKIISPKRIDPGTNLLIRIDIPENIYIIARAVRCEKNAVYKNYKVSLRYDVISEPTRDRIVKFIFDKSREKRNMMM